MNTLSSINEFLENKRFAMVGVSRNSKSFSRKMFQEFLNRGYEVIPVNPHVSELQGHRCFARVQDIQQRVTDALLMTSSESLADVLGDCAEAGVSLAWVYGVSGDRHVDPKVQTICDEHGVRLIAGYCPYMFMSSTTFVHRFHGKLAKFFGNYPSP